MTKDTIYAIHHDKDEVKRALEQCKGVYQENIIMGYESLSGSTLKGKASSYARHYKTSRTNLLARCKAAGIKIEERIGKHNKRELHIG